MILLRSMTIKRRGCTLWQRRLLLHLTLVGVRLQGILATHEGQRRVGLEKVRVKLHVVVVRCQMKILPKSSPLMVQKVTSHCFQKQKCNANSKLHLEKGRKKEHHSQKQLCAPQVKSLPRQEVQNQSIFTTEIRQCRQPQQVSF